MTTDARRILLVEDDEGLRELIADELTDDGHEVIAVADAEAAAGVLRAQHPDLVVSDLRLPGASGRDLLMQSRQLAVPPAFILVTAFGSVAQAVEALRQGADDFLTKPLNLAHLRVSVERALRRQAMQAEITRYRHMLTAGDFHGLIGRSACMRQLFEQIRRIARAQGPVLILGESGVGKDLVARAVHAESDRAEGPFVAVNCAGIPPDLLESELFGHAAGAFSGAKGARRGLFAEADGGTLLLDEIGEMPPAMQSKLLRILQGGQLRPVGENRERTIDVRVVAATHRQLEDLIAAGRFREDLYYRLETFAFRVPPLREREDDVDLLAAHFVARFAAAVGRDIQGLSPAAMEVLRSYPFPGNVRELSNAVERAVAFSNGAVIDRDHLPARIRDRKASPLPSTAGPVLIRDAELPPLRELERRYVAHVLRAVRGNKRRAADILQIGRRTLYRYLDEMPEVTGLAEPGRLSAEP